MAIQDYLRTTIVTTLLVASSVCFAQTRDQAQRNLNTAQQQYNDADARLSQARQNENNAQSNVDALRNLQNTIPQQIADLKRQIENMKRDAREASSTLPSIKADVDARKKLVADKKPTLQTNQDRLASAKGVVDQTKAKALAAFEAGDTFRGIKAALDSAQSKNDAATAACLARHTGSPEFIALQQEVTASEARVKQLRNDSGDREALAEASQSWISSKSKLENLKTTALGTDATTVSARQELTQAQANLRTLKQKFDAELSAQPEMAAALRDQSAVQTALDTATADLKRAEMDATAAQRLLEQKQGLIANAKDAQSRIESDIAQRQTDLNSVPNQLNAAQQTLRNIQNDEATFQRMRDDATRRIQTAQAALARAKN